MANSMLRSVIVYRSAWADTSVSSSSCPIRWPPSPRASTVRAPSTVSVVVELMTEYDADSVMYPAVARAR